MRRLAGAAQTQISSWAHAIAVLLPFGETEVPAPNAFACSGLRVLGAYADVVETVRGVGYRFRDPRR